MSVQLLPGLIAPICLLLLSAPGTAAEDYGPVGPFRLTERGGQVITNADLSGKVWIASFVFTRCTGPCPQVSLAMKRLQEELADVLDLRLVTFTVDPERDGPEELASYARHFGADPSRWLFLTGKEEEIHSLLHDSFKVGVQRLEGPQVKEGEEFDHSTRLVLVDRQGHIRGYYQGIQLPYGENPQQDLEESLARLRREARSLAGADGADFPLINASLNGAAGIFLCLGWLAIRRRLVRVHISCMVVALMLSAVFLGSYLYFHIVIRGGVPTRFESQAPDAPTWVRRVYLAVLLTHTILAALAAPMALYTAWLGLRNRLERHVRLARWTLPIWLYVSVTGVVVYWMLYRLYASP